MGETGRNDTDGERGGESKKNDGMGCNDDDDERDRQNLIVLCTRAESGQK